MERSERLRLGREKRMGLDAGEVCRQPKPAARSGAVDDDSLSPDARLLLQALATLPEAPFPGRIMPGQAATALGFGPARACRLLRRLVDLGYYEYDISAYSGRLTLAGRRAAARKIDP